MTYVISSDTQRKGRRVELLNSKADLEAADRRFHFHSQTDPTKLETDGPFTIARGQGPDVFDLEGRKDLDAVASLWCASLGFSDRRLAAAGAAALEPCRSITRSISVRTRMRPNCPRSFAALLRWRSARLFYSMGVGSRRLRRSKRARYYQMARGKVPPQDHRAARRVSRLTVMAARISGPPECISPSICPIGRRPDDAAAFLS